MLTRSKTDHLTPKQIFTLITTTTETTSTCYSTTAKFPQWRRAMSEEIDALLKQGTWTLISPSSHHPPLGCKWTYKIKHKLDDTIA